MASFWEELKRRKVVRVAMTYVVVSWLLIQVADVVLSNIEAPTWVFPFILLLLGIGFPVATILAWAFEVTSGGLKKEISIGSPNQRVPIVVISLAALAFMGAIFFWQFDKENLSTDAVAGDANARQSNPVLAVLPFANMSSSSENGYIADGMTEDVITLLAQSLVWK